MLLRALCATALLVPVPAVPQAVEQSPAPRVLCRMKTGYKAGTAFRVGPQYLVTAAHVISEGACEIDGQPIKVLYRSRSADYAILEDERAGKFVPVDCGGFSAGGHYLAIGHARAMEQLTVVPLVGTGKMDSGMALLGGVFEVQPGMSGGPIIDVDTGRVVGIVNAADWESGISYSIELKSTPVCGKAA